MICQFRINKHLLKLFFSGRIHDAKYLFTLFTIHLQANMSKTSALIRRVNHVKISIQTA